MVSELLYGEPFSIQKTLNEEWVKIKTELDNYTAWVSAHQLLPLHEPPLSIMTKPVQYGSNGQIIGYMSGYIHQSKTLFIR